jgi:phosphate transport system substrate-binding protein
MKKIFTMFLVLASGMAFAQAGKDITVISRESGSGTRTAFIELTGVESKDASGKKVDGTTKEAVVANQTEIVISSVAGNPNAIGYISLGSLNNRVKALNIEGVAATADNIKAGTYKLARPFNITLAPKANAGAQDFVNFILSKEGQAVVANGYITVAPNAAAFTSAKPSGRMVIAGSSSVTPVMEVLTEAYAKINPALDIEIQMSDSSAGMQAAINNTCDIGMASRALTEKELTTLKAIEIAIDGIAVIVSNDNTVSNLTAAQVKEIYTGARTKW